MAYSKEEKTKIIDDIFNQLIEGKSLRKTVIKSGISCKVFFQWIKQDKDKSNQYALASGIRADVLFEEILDIADDGSGDYQNTPEGLKLIPENIQRSRVRIDARKFYLSKVMPKKYGEKIDITSDGDKISQPPVTFKIINK